MNTVNNFKKGDIVYHKATNKKCVVIEFKDNTIIVRTEEDQKKEYYPYELLSEAEYEKRVRGIY